MPATTQLAVTRLNVNDARCLALFASGLQPSDAPTAETVAQAINRAIRPVWSVGVTPGPLTRALGLDTIKGRIVVDEFLSVPGHPDVFAAGDAAAAPDLTRPGQHRRQR